MSRMIRLFLTLCLLTTLAILASGDGTATTNRRARKKIILDKNFVLSVGQEMLTADGKLKIKFVSVPEDSRCPKGVNCIWAGNARIVLQVSQTGGKFVMLELNTNPREASDAAEGAFGLYQLKLVEVAPYPVDGQTIAPRSYAATLVVSKKS